MKRKVRRMSVEDQREELWFVLHDLHMTGNNFAGEVKTTTFGNCDDQVIVACINGREVTRKEQRKTGG